MILGLCGLLQSEKDICANILVNEHNYTKIRFEDARKNLLYLLFNFQQEQLENDYWLNKTNDFWSNEVNKNILNKDKKIMD